MSNRILETVTGYENAIRALASHVDGWNQTNGANRMQMSSTLRADDQDGSGEFYEAVWINSETAENCADEIYQIETCW